MVETQALRFHTPQLAFLEAWTEYLVDSVERTVLFWDVMRKRGRQLPGEHREGWAPGAVLRL